MERKIALITGATSGIGEACARKFAAGGYDIIINCRKPEKGEALKAELARSSTTPDWYSEWTRNMRAISTNGTSCSTPTSAACSR